MRSVLSILLAAASVHAGASQAGDEVVANAAAEAPAAQPAVAQAAVVPAVAKLSLVSSGEQMVVEYGTSASAEECKDFTPAGKVYDASTLREKLLPFISKMVERSRRMTGVLPEVEKTLPAGEPVWVQSYADWPAEHGMRAGSCGPLTLQLTPQAGKKYQVEFRFLGDNKCKQVLLDVTDPAAKQEVEAPVTAACAAPKKSLFGLF
jgi:hypothetical protein